MPSTRITPGGTAIQGLTRNIHTWSNPTATSGTDTTPVAGTWYYASVFIPGDMFVTGISVLEGSASTNGNIIVALYGIDGVLIANSATAGTATTTAAQTQNVPFTAPLVVPGPAYLLLASQYSNTGDRLRTIPAFCDGGSQSGSVTGVVGTVPSPLTVSATIFTADKGPVSKLY